MTAGLIGVIRYDNRRKHKGFKQQVSPAGKKNTCIKGIHIYAF